MSYRTIPSALDSESFLKLGKQGATALTLAATLALSACGGTEDQDPDRDPNPPSDRFAVPSPVGALPMTADTREASTEVGAGAFKAYFASSNKDFNNGVRRPGWASLDSGVFDLWSDEDGRIKMVTASNKYEFVQTRRVQDLVNREVDYEYADADGLSGTMFIVRGENGLRDDGYYILTPAGTVSELRASFVYGWPTPVAGLPSGTAVYSSVDGGQLFTTDGRRIFGREVALTADFTNGTVSGTLFDNRGKLFPPVDFDLEAHVEILNAPIVGSEIDASTGLMISINDNASTTEPMADQIIGIGSTVRNAEVKGSFIGPNGEALGGYFSGEVDATYSKAGAATLGFRGIFSGVRP